MTLTDVLRAIQTYREQLVSAGDGTALRELQRALLASLESTGDAVDQVIGRHA